jgi:hypothetical protein
MNYREKRDVSGSVLRSILFLFVALCAAGLYYLMVNMKSWVTNNPKKLELYYKQAKKFSPDEKRDFLKKHAGFWKFQSYAMVGGAPLKKVDLLELKDNGILWQVIEWDIKMPSGRNAVFYQIRTGYVEPYGIFKNDTLNDMYTIHQTFITSNDTCFGGWNFLDLWVISKAGASLVVGRRNYEHYNGVPADFFPRGMIDLVGIGGGGSNKFFRKIGNGPVGVQIELKTAVPGIRKVKPDSASTNAMMLPDCLNICSLSDLVKKELFNEYINGNLKPFDKDSVVSYIERYYQPLFVYEQTRLFPRSIPHQVTVSFEVLNNGTLDDIRLVSPQLHNDDKMLQGELVRELSTWRFPRCDFPLPITYTFVLP